MSRRSRNASLSRSRSATRGRLLGALAVALSLSTAVFASDVPPGAAAGTPRVRAAAVDTESARFFVCGSGPRSTCVVDGDTFWYRGAKIRIADINTPEVSRPGCPGEAALGARATARLAELLNAGAFSLTPAGRDEDRYGRKLRIVTRGGQSLGERLVAEGLAERWRGFRRTWC